MARTFSLIIFFLFFSQIGLGQWKPQFIEKLPTDTLFALTKEKGYGSLSKRIHFPEYDFFISTDRGFDLLGDSLTNRTIHLPLSGDIWIDSAFKANQVNLFMRFYTANVKSITFSIYAGLKIWEKTFEQDQDGFQVPLDYGLADWKVIGQEATVKPEIRIKLNTVNAVAKTIFLVQELSLYRSADFSFTSTHPLFSDLFKFKPENRPTTYDNRYPSEFVSHASPDFRDFKTQIGNLKMVQIDTAISEKQAFDRVLLKLLERYPFYEAKKLNRKQVMADFRRDMDTITNAKFAAYATRIGQRIQSTFEDPHFKIVSPTGHVSTLVKSPVRVYEIRGQLQIGAILDTLYAGKLTLGDQVTHVDGIAVAQRIKQELSGFSLNIRNENSLRQLVLNRLLDKPKSDSTLLTVNGVQGIRKVRLYYNRKLVIAPMFRPVHGERKWVNPDVFYYRINLWDSPVYSMLVSSWNKVVDAKTLVLDLRGNGGGDKYSVVELYSMFINKPTTLYKYKPYGDNRYDSLVVRPNPLFHYGTDKKISILVDNGTACASEIFIMAMKKLPNVTVIGSDRTMGAMASSIRIAFPSGVTIYTNSLMDFPHFDNDKKGIENVGIAPDILKKPQQIQDLRPYNDLILKTAVYQAGSIANLSNL